MSATTQVDKSKLEELREQINHVDKQVVLLLNKRASVALQIGGVKSANGTDVYDPNRERRVLDMIDNLNDGPLSKGAVEDIYAAIISACREIQLR